MSAGNFQELVQQKLLLNASAVSQKTFGEMSRRVLESAKVKQCLVLNQRAVLALQTGFVAGVAPAEVDKKLLTKYRRELRIFLRGLNVPPPDELKNGLFNDIVKFKRLRWGKTILYMPFSFDTVKDKIKDFHKDFAKKELAVEFDVNKQFGKITQFDHGADGPASGTFSAATFGTVAALDSGIDQDQLLKTVELNLQAIYAEQIGGYAGTAIARRLYNLAAAFAQSVKADGTLDAGASMLITPLDASENQSRARIERKEQENLLKAMELSIKQHLSADEYLNFVGSSTLKQKMTKVTLERFANNITESKHLKKKVSFAPGIKTAKLNTSAESKNNKTKKAKGKVGKVSVPGGRGRKAIVLPGGAGGRKERAQLSKVSLQSFLTILNSQLQNQVAKNMGSPRLENRTGRFLSSIRATDVQTTARGFPSVGYTYQKQPYQVFESSSGSRFASPDRDPRRLIELSIREIAAQNQIGRLFARRI